MDHFGSCRVTASESGQYQQRGGLASARSHDGDIIRTNLGCCEQQEPGSAFYASPLIPFTSHQDEH
ncbi:MAG: hypothetical protein K0M55_00175 [Rhizobium sp.]|nr:hypothetical protein [Rhizobium sp.]